MIPLNLKNTAVKELRAVWGKIKVAESTSHFVVNEKDGTLKEFKHKSVHSYIITSGEKEVVLSKYGHRKYADFIMKYKHGYEMFHIPLWVDSKVCFHTFLPFKDPYDMESFFVTKHRIEKDRPGF